jgi:two-component system, cell cycle response regulator
VKILIADDDAVSRVALRAALVSLGHQVVMVDDGIKAVEVLSAPDAPSLAILDWAMPGLDGLAVCRAIRLQSGRYIYAILLTAYDAAADMIEALDAGADDFLTKPFKFGELRARLRAGERVIELQEHLLRSQEVLRYEASHDRLTGLWNRGWLLDELGRELRRNLRERAPLALVMADVDHFKRINDTHGHTVGDAVLRQIGQRIQSTLRVSDSVGRYGGEEFLLLLPRADINGGRDVAERVRSIVAGEPIVALSVTLNVTMSLGVACGEPGAADETLIQSADQALYRAKANGRNRVELA